MDDDFQKALDGLTVANPDMSVRAFFEKYAPAIRQKMRDLNRPLTYFLPLIRKALRRAADEATGRKADPESGRDVPLRTAQTYMSEFAPARAATVPIKTDKREGIADILVLRPAKTSPPPGSSAVPAQGYPVVPAANPTQPMRQRDVDRPPVGSRDVNNDRATSINPMPQPLE